METRPERRQEAYCFAKVKQDEMVLEYAQRFGLPYVIVRPGYVYGPANEAITGRVGIGTFGIFLHLGGSNTIPLTYVDNCADAIALAGLRPGVDGEVFNVVDDELPTSRQFLRLYKRNVSRFTSHLCTACGELHRFVISGRSIRCGPKDNCQPPSIHGGGTRIGRRTRYSNEKLKAAAGLETDRSRGRRVETLFRELPGGKRICLRSPS